MSGDDGHRREENAKCSPFGVITFLSGLASGTFSAVICKIAYDTKSVGIDDVEKDFAKPIFMVLIMFAAMMPALLFWKIQQMNLPEDQRDKIEPGSLLVLVIPSVCDLLCSMLLLVAQVYITASLWQMMRGSIIVITALLKRFALGHSLKKHMWVGIAVITVAMVLAASTSIIGSADVSEAANSKDPKIGIALVLVGCLAQGVQYVFEEKVMSDNNTPPLIVIGFEGLWGTILTILFVYPIAYALPGLDNGSYENPYDAIAMIRNSPTLPWLIAGFVLTVTVYNCMAVYVTKALSAIWHAILDNFRPITIWIVCLIIHYSGSRFGEAWVPASWIQLIALIILLFGTAIYNGSLVNFDDVEYQALPLEEKGAKEVSMASIAAAKSPLIHKHHHNNDDSRISTGSKEEAPLSGQRKPKYYDSV